MTDFKINEDEIPRIRIREEDLEPVDIEALADKLGAIAKAGLMDQLMEVMGFDPNADADLMTTVTDPDPWPKVTFDSLAEIADKMKADKARLDAETAIRIVRNLEEFVRRDPKCKDFSFEAGDWMILPADIFDSIDVPLPIYIKRALDWMEPGEFYAINSKHFSKLPEPGELWWNRFKPGEQL